MSKFYSDTLDKAIKLLWFQPDTSRYQEGVALLRQAMADRETEACYFLGRCYGWGDGNLQKNVQRAKELFATGIRMNSDLCILGAVRLKVFTPDLKRMANHTLEEALAQVKQMGEDGDAMAQELVGQFYFWGDMLAEIQKPADPLDARTFEERNAAAALEWFQKAAEQGLESAFQNIYFSLRDGFNGVKPDPEAALKYAESVTGIDLTDYCVEISGRYERLNRYGDAIRWLERGLSGPHPNAACYNNLGVLCLNGLGMDADAERAVELFFEAAKRGEKAGPYNLGRCYQNGAGVEKDEEQAFRCFRRAAELGHADAERCLAWCFYKGSGAPVDYAQSVQWAAKAVEQGNSQAKYLLGMCCLYGRGTAADFERAVGLLEENALETENGHAYSLIADAYDKGLNGHPDAALAVEYYGKAADLGCTSAAMDLERFKKTIFGKWKRVSR